MSRVLAITMLALFLLTSGVAPVLAKRGGGHGGGGHGGGHGGRHGGGGGGGCIPEIDPGVAPSAIALLAGGLLILRDKFSRKQSG